MEKDSYDVEGIKPHFDFVGEGATRKYKCKVNPEKGMLIKHSTFSGSVYLSGLYDVKGRDLSEKKDEYPPL